MSMWDQFQRELDKAGDAARNVLDEGKLRIELFRVRQLADKAAESLGYAIHRAKRDGRELEADVMTRLDSALGAHETEVQRIEAELEKLRKGDAEEPAGATASSAADGSAATGA